MIARRPGSDIVLRGGGETDDVIHARCCGGLRGKPGAGAIGHGGIGGIRRRCGRVAQGAEEAVRAAGRDAVRGGLGARRQVEANGGILTAVRTGDVAEREQDVITARAFVERDGVVTTGRVEKESGNHLSSRGAVVAIEDKVSTAHVERLTAVDLVSVLDGVIENQRPVLHQRVTCRGTSAVIGPSESHRLVTDLLECAGAGLLQVGVDGAFVNVKISSDGQGAGAIHLALAIKGAVAQNELVHRLAEAVHVEGGDGCTT